MPEFEFDKRNTKTPQGRTPRRAIWTGAIGVHTCENTPDYIVPDTGAEGVLNYIFIRTDPGSYHTLVDSDSICWVANPKTWETWQIAARDRNNRGYNWYTAGLSMAYKAHLWGTNEAYEARMIDNAGKAAAEMFLMFTNGDVNRALQCVKWLTPDQVAAGEAGFFEHGLVQPVDRSDAWSKHPKRDWLREQLVISTKHYLGDATSTEERKVGGKMIDTTHRSNGQGIKVMINQGKVYLSWQTGSPGSWGLYTKWDACPLFGNRVPNISPNNDPGTFDNVAVEVNDKDELTVTAFHSLYGPGGSWSTWEKSGTVKFNDWVRIP